MNSQEPSNGRSPNERKRSAIGMIVGALQAGPDDVPKKLDGLESWKDLSLPRKAVLLFCTVISLLLLDQGLAQKFGWSPVRKRIQSWLARPVEAKLVDPPFPPPYSNVDVILNRLPATAKGDRFRIMVDKRVLSEMAGDFRLINGGQGHGNLTISGRVFDWAKQSSGCATVVIQFDGQSRHTYDVQLAQPPHPTLVEEDGVYLLSTPDARTQREYPPALLGVLGTGLQDAAPIYAFGPGTARIRLPEFVIENRHLFELAVNSKSIDIPSSPDAFALLSDHEYPSTRAPGWHDLKLTFMKNEVVGEIKLLRYLKPLCELDAKGQPWSIPPRKERFWVFDSAKTPDLINTSEFVVLGDKHGHPHHNIPFPHLSMAVQAGTYVVETRFQGLAGGSLSTVFADFEDVFPSGAGQFSHSFKFSRSLNWADDEPDPRLAALNHQDAEFFRRDGTSEIKFSFGESGLDICDDAWHTARLAVRVIETKYRKPQIRFDFGLDGEHLDHWTRKVESRPVRFTPELRHRACRESQFRDFRIYFLPEP